MMNKGLPHQLQGLQPRQLPVWHTTDYDQNKTTVTKPDRHKITNGVNGDVS
jgi:hypothetical protein